MAFTPDPNLLVTSNALQEYLVDANGLPLSNGVVTFYHDNARTTYKNVYYQSGSPGAYTYIALSNPVIVGGNGTLTDPYGNEINIFYYPFSETNSNVVDPYYITIDSSAGQRIRTIQNFPYTQNQVAPTNASVSTLKNLIVNNGFWRGGNGIPTLSTSVTNVLNQIIAPSAHEGFYYPDYQFFKDVTGANDTITFTKFGDTSFLQSGNPPNQNVTPEYYLNFTCASTGSGETYKYIQFPIQAHVKNLTQTQAIFTLWTQNNAGSINNTIDVVLYQYMGTGSVNSVEVPIGTINPNNSWALSQILFTFPTLTNSVSATADDGWYIRLKYPTGKPFNMNVAKPSLYIGNDVTADVPTNDFQTYDEINSIISSPRTGDFRLSLNSFCPFGWVPANNGTIGNASSGATSRANADTWLLYNLLYNSVQDHWAPVIGGRGGSALSDFNANKPITLTRALGYVLAGANPQFVSPIVITGVDTITGKITCASTATISTGTPVQFINSGGGLPTGLSANTVYFVRVLSPSTTQFSIFNTIDDCINNVNNIIPSDAGTGTNSMYPALGGFEGSSTNTLTSSNLPTSFTGTISSTTVNNLSTTGATTLTGLSGAGTTPVNFTVSGGGQSFTNLQPMTYMNVFIKL